MNAYIFGLFSYIAWGSGDIFGTIASRKIGGYKTTFWIMTAASVMFAPLAYIYWHTLTTASLPIIFLAIISGFLYQSGNFALNEALNKADASIVLTIMGSFGAFIILFSTIFLREPLTILHTIIISIIFIGIFLCTYAPHAQVNKESAKGLWLALYSAISFGIFFTVSKIFSETLGWFWPIYLSFLWLPLILLYLHTINIKPSVHDLKTAYSPLLWNLLLLRSGDFIFNIGLQQGLSAVIVPIASASPTLSVILSVFIFHDKPSYGQIIGILLALTGIVALGFVGNHPIAF